MTDVPSSAAGGLEEDVGEDGLGLQRRLEDLQTLQNSEEMQLMAVFLAGP